MLNKEKMSEKKGFTLIELVVVMAIIAVLSLLIIAAITAARRQSTNTQRSGNVKTIETALESRYSKCGSYFSVKTGVTNCAAITTTDVSTVVDGLKTNEFLTQTLNGLSSTSLAGYNFVTKTENFEIRACPVTSATDDTETDCTSTDSLYTALR